MCTPFPLAVKKYSISSGAFSAFWFICSAPDNMAAGRPPTTSTFDTFDHIICHFRNGVRFDHVHLDAVNHTEGTRRRLIPNSEIPILPCPSALEHSHQLFWLCPGAKSLRSTLHRPSSPRSRFRTCPPSWCCRCCNRLRHDQHESDREVEVAQVQVRSGREYVC
jgi:hypothetical protein